MKNQVHSGCAAIIISVQKTVVGLIYLIVFKLINMQCYGFDQNGLCTLEIPTLPNICERSDNIVRASETKSDCQAGSKCWCIIINNENRIFDGVLIVELVQMFNNVNSSPYAIQFTQVKSHFTYNGIVLGLNHIFLQQYTPPGALTNITSIKIRNDEICKLGESPPLPNTYLKYYNFQQPTDTDRVNYEYFTDCMNRIYYTYDSQKYCSTYRPEFMIERRYTLDNRLYWCIIINNDNYFLTSANRLHIVYSSPNRNYVYFPQDAYIEREVHGSDFHLGNRRTIIAISEYYNQLANLNSITIDNQPICSYFEPFETTTQRPYVPAVMLPATNLSTKITDTQIENYPPIMPVPIMTIPIMPVPIMTVPIMQVPNTPVPIMPDPIPPIFTNPITKPCGVKQIQANPLISFGSNTKPGDWPWHAAIYKLKSKTTNRNFICGGTLINRKTIVTAAHCVIEFNNLIVIPERLTAELGRYDLSQITSAQEYNIFEVKQHEYYNLDSFQNDIALLILANYVRETPNISFICLPSPDVFLRKQVGTAVGWGTTDINNDLQKELKAAPFLVVEDITCLESNREFFGKYLTKTNFCAGYRNNTNVCRGDSGGGLVFQQQNQWFLGGITSIGVPIKSVENQCDITQYVLFTDVTKFLIWIKQNS